MPSAASIAQFMTMMGGGVNPNALKKSLETFDGQKITKPQEFSATLNKQTGEQTTPNLAQTGAVLKPVLSPDSVVKVPLGNDDIPVVTLTPNGGIPSIDIDIEQLSDNDLETIVTLALQTKGVSDEGIDHLRDIFGDDVLMTILQDPIMNAQLDDKLLEVGIISIKPNDDDIDNIETPALFDTVEKESENIIELVASINQVLSDNPSRIAKTLSFAVDEESQIDELVKTLIQKNSGDAQELSFEIVETIQTLAPNFMALVQRQDNAQGQKPSLTNAPMPMPMTVDGFDPFGQRPMNIFAASSSNGDAASLPQQDMDAILQSVMNKQPQTMAAESIADRLSTIMNNAQNANASTLSFDGMMGQLAGGDSALAFDIDALSMMPLEAALKTAGSSTNPLLSTQPALVQSHPASHMVAMSMIKSSGQNMNGQDIQSYRLQLDPPEMGRLDIQLEMIEGTAQMKAVISAEKPETLNMLQRDMHTLLKAMQDAGFENMSQNDFTFNQSNDNDFNMGGRDNGRGQDTPLMNSELVEIEITNTEMTDIIDPITGQRSINMVV